MQKCVFVFLYNEINDKYWKYGKITYRLKLMNDENQINIH